MITITTAFIDAKFKKEFFFMIYILTAIVDIEFIYAIVKIWS